MTRVVFIGPPHKSNCYPQFQQLSGSSDAPTDAFKSYAETFVLTPFLGTCPGWQDRVAVQCGLLMRMVADEGEVECD